MNQYFYLFKILVCNEGFMETGSVSNACCTALLRTEDVMEPAEVGARRALTQCKGCGSSAQVLRCSPGACTGSDAELQ